MRGDCKFLAHDKAVRCRATLYTKCNNCPFYITDAEADAKLEVVHARLRSLPEDEQAYIAGKYHKGRLVWQ